MHISHKHWFPLSCPRHTDQPEPPQLTQDRGPYGGPLQAGGMRGGPEVHQVGVDWGQGSSSQGCGGQTREGRRPEGEVGVSWAPAWSPPG